MSVHDHKLRKGDLFHQRASQLPHMRDLGIVEEQDFLSYSLEYNPTCEHVNKVLIHMEFLLHDIHLFT